MIRAFPCVAALLVPASTLSAAAIAEPPAPQPSGPVAMPYPNPEPLPPCPNMFCLPQTAAAQETPAPSPVPTHKHIAGVKYEDIAKSDADAAAGDQVIEVQSISWGKIDGAGTVYSADPMEGGQIAARKYTQGKPTYGNATFDSAPAAAESKPKVSEIPVTKQMDVSSPKIMSGEGQPDQPTPGTMAVAKTTATFKTLAGVCVKGKHLDKVVIVARSGGRYTLHDAIVTDVTPAGDGMETVSLTYVSREN